MIQDITESMSENILHITSYTGLVLFHDFKEEQILQISNITNKKRKKDNTSELRNSPKKKTKAIHDDNNDNNDNSDKNNNKYFLTSTNIFNWYNSLNKVKEYINNKKKRPSIHDKDKEIQKLGRWTSLQQANYKKRIEAMRNDNIYYEWSRFLNEYQEYLLTSKNININKWYDNLKKVKEYIDIYNKKPTESDINEEIQKLGKWISLQQLNYNKKAMKDENIYSKWSQFTIEYHKYFLNIHDKWYNSLNEVKKYIDKNEKKPTISNKDNEIKKLGRWINLQQANYKKREKVFIDDNICYEWSQFMKDYQQYVLNTCNICGKKDHKTINCLQFFTN
jgi:hypothetical protein